MRVQASLSLNPGNARLRLQLATLLPPFALTPVVHDKAVKVWSPWSCLVCLAQCLHACMQGFKSSITKLLEAKTLRLPDPANQIGDEVPWGLYARYHAFDPSAIALIGQLLVQSTPGFDDCVV